jgi:hypothetical protein
MQFSGYVKDFGVRAASSFKIKHLSFSETLVLIYHTTRRHIPEQRIEILTCAKASTLNFRQTKI